MLYGVLGADLNPDTPLTFGMDYQNIKPRDAFWGGNPVYFSDQSRTDFSRSFNPAADRSPRNIQTRTTFAALEHRLANDWKIKGTLT